VFKVPAIFAVLFKFISSQMHANFNPGQFLISYLNGFPTGSSPKFASIDDAVQSIKTAGKRRSTVGLIGSFRSANLDLSGYKLLLMVKLTNWNIYELFLILKNFSLQLTHELSIQREENPQFVF
jgi:hypothetical protein